MRVRTRLAALIAVTLAGASTVGARQHPPAPRGQLRVATAAAVSLESEGKLHAAFEHFYNLEFAAGRRLFNQVIEAEPASAAVRAYLAGAFLYEILARQGTLQSQLFVTSNEFLDQQRDPPDPKLARPFRQVADEAQELAQKRLKENPEDADGLYALGLVYGALANYAAGVEGKYLRGVRLGEKAFKAHRKLRKLHPEIGDAGITLGVHNYVLGSLPRLQRFLLFFLGARGSRERGLEYLQDAAEHGEFLSGYARILLTVALIREEKLEEAVSILERLHESYLSNPLFAIELVRLYRRLAQFEEARKLGRELNRQLVTQPHNPSVVTIADAYLELIRTELAAGKIEAAAGLLSHVAESPMRINKEKREWFMLETGKYHDLKGEREQAIWFYDEVRRLDADPRASSLASSYKKKPYRLESSNRR